MRRTNRKPYSVVAYPFCGLFGLLLLVLFLFSCRVPAGEVVFSWRQCSGSTLRVMFNQHPYAEGIKRKLLDFEALTGIKVAYVMYPEDTYFRRLDEAFERGVASPDVYMIGAYNVWQYAPKGHMAALDTFILDSVKTRSGYNLSDFFTGIIGAFRWNGKPGARVGEGPLWAVPIGFEANALTYNREVLAKYRMPPPKTLEELYVAGRVLQHFEGVETYGVAVRGMGGWNSLHSGYLTTYVNYGAVDMAVENGRLVSKVNSPEAVTVTDLWVRMLRECGPADWARSDWYRCLADIGDRKAAFMLDADILGYYANYPGASSQSGKLGLVPPPAPSGTAKHDIRSNLWVWGLAVNPGSENRDAAWLFVQYFTGREFQAYSVLEWKSVNPPRRSVFEDPAFRSRIASMEGYADTFSAIVDNTAIFFTPNPYFFEISERWATTIRNIANGNYASTQEGLDDLKSWMDKKLADVKVE